MSGMQFLPSAEAVHAFSRDFCDSVLKLRNRVKYEVRDRHTLYGCSQWMRDPKEVHLAKTTIIEVIEDLYNYLSGFRQQYGAGQGSAEIEKIHRFYGQKIADLEDQLNAEKKAKDDVMRRLSEMSAQILKSGNPQIADLSDQYRPTKIAEKLGSLYDDDWSDALEALTEKAKLPEKESCGRLYDLLKDCYDMCSEVANSQVDQLAIGLKDPTRSESDIAAITGKVQQLPVGRGKALSQTVGPGVATRNKGRGQGIGGPIGAMDSLIQPLGAGNKSSESTEEMDKAVREFRKNFPLDALSRVNEHITEILKPKYPKEIMEATGKYVGRCIELCWLAKIQFPPMILMFNVKSGDKFNSELYNVYSSRGSTVDYVTWPPLYLYEGGPLMSRGTAQGLKDQQHTKF